MFWSIGQEKKDWIKESVILAAVIVMSFPVSFYTTTLYYRITDKIGTWQEKRKKRSLSM